MAVTLCVPPRNGELCAPVRITLTEQSTFMELTARHRIVGVESDPESDAVVLQVEITDPETARPVHVRFELVEPGSPLAARSVLVGTVDHGGQKVDVIGTYLGVVSEEN